MTIAHHAPALPAPSFASALGVLRARGMRISLARRGVLEALYDADRPVTAEELAGRVPDSDLASVHRNLAVLEEIGLVRHVHLGHGAGRYVLAGLDAQSSSSRASRAANTRRCRPSDSTRCAG